MGAEYHDPGAHLSATFRGVCQLWTRLRFFELRPGVPDQIEWKLVSANGEYSTKSAYMRQFSGDVDTDLDQLIWKVWAPPKCKIFACAWR